MAEVYINSSETLQLYIYDGDTRVSADATPSFTWVDVDDSTATGTLVVSTVAVTGASPSYNYYEVIWPADLSETSYCRSIEGTWDAAYNGQAITRIENIDVVQPLVGIGEILQEFPQFDTGGSNPKTNDELKRMERDVRYVIESYCRQTFGFKGNKTKKVISDGNDYLQLPDRIERLEEVKYEDTVYFDRWTAANIADAPSGTNIGDVKTEIVTFDKDYPYTVRRKFFRGIPWDVKQAVDETLLSRRHIFKTEYMYSVNADWGWSRVPGRVSEAAKELINYYFCNDSAYHKRGINVVRSADWRLEFAADPYSTTGSVIADQLLSNYVNFGIKVI